ncbi:unnamed protein product [Diatraea saccharalis]|uniref:Uncharacterized protein n=1 Tax=Diatraea saccharalis TaxID=40085 RepID=A0A9N9R5Z6_9NEOP|nr:unnamed protein product [Diatraea saccharalis]
MSGDEESARAKREDRMKREREDRRKYEEEKADSAKREQRENSRSPIKEDSRKEKRQEGNGRSKNKGTSEKEGNTGKVNLKYAHNTPVRIESDREEVNTEEIRGNLSRASSIGSIRSIGSMRSCYVKLNATSQKKAGNSYNHSQKERESQETPKRETRSMTATRQTKGKENREVGKDNEESEDKDSHNSFNMTVTPIPISANKKGIKKGYPVATGEYEGLKATQDKIDRRLGLKEDREMDIQTDLESEN